MVSSECSRRGFRYSGIGDKQIALDDCKRSISQNALTQQVNTTEFPVSGCSSGYLIAGHKCHRVSGDELNSKVGPTHDKDFRRIYKENKH